jgi:hypothetical protein
VPAEITPEPSEQERAAIEEALATIATDTRAPAAWWSKGIRESVLDDDE